MKLVAAALVALVAAAGSVRAEPLAEADEVLRRVALSLVAAGEAVPAEVAWSAAEPAMVETGAAAEALQPNTAPAEEDAPRFREERGFIGDAFDKIVGAGVRTTGKLTSLTKSLVGDNRDNMQQKYEDCLGCRLVWKQVEMDVSNARYIEDVQASFEHNCMDAQKSNIFYKVCEDMYDDMYAMTDDYMSNKYTVDQMCIRAKICTL